MTSPPVTIGLPKLYEPSLADHLMFLLDSTSQSVGAPVSVATLWRSGVWSHIGQSAAGARRTTSVAAARQAAKVSFVSLFIDESRLKLIERWRSSTYLF